MDVERGQLASSSYELADDELKHSFAPRAGLPAAAREALIALGPTLLLRPPTRAALDDDLARCLRGVLFEGTPTAMARVEPEGVLEMLTWCRAEGPIVLVRLPDTDFAAWERLCAGAMRTPREAMPMARARWSHCGSLSHGAREARAWWATPVRFVVDEGVVGAAIRVSMRGSVLAWRVWELVRGQFELEFRVCDGIARVRA